MVPQGLMSSKKFYEKKKESATILDKSQLQIWLTSHSTCCNCTKAYGTSKTFATKQSIYFSRIPRTIRTPNWNRSSTSLSMLSEYYVWLMAVDLFIDLCAALWQEYLKRQKNIRKKQQKQAGGSWFDWQVRPEITWQSASGMGKKQKWNKTKSQ